MMKIIEQSPLAAYNTFGIEARCGKLVRFETADDVRDLFAGGSMAGQWSVLGGGSNILFTGDYDGTLLHPSGEAIAVVAREGERVRIRVSAGTVWDDMVAWCVAHGFWGAENLSNIPGQVGASPVQNVGAYGVEAGDILSSVTMFCPDNGKMLTMAAGHCDLGYRDSIFKRSLRGRVVITEVEFVLSTTASPRLGYGDLQQTVEEYGGPTLENIRRAVIHIRGSKLPDPKVLGNAGSFFKNPVIPSAEAEALKREWTSMPLYPAAVPGYSKLAAGWLIDQCGWKGRRMGNAGVHEKQALVLVNYGGATGRDIIALSDAVRADVRAKFGVDIEPEVNII